MKYLEWCLVILMVTAVASGFTAFHIMPMESQFGQVNQFNVPGQYDANMNPIDTDSMAYKVTKFEFDYSNAGIQDSSQQYLQSGGDFMRGLHYFTTVFIGGTITGVPLLNAFGIPSDMHIFVTLPLMFLWIIGVVQFVSGRSFSSTD